MLRTNQSRAGGPAERRARKTHLRLASVLIGTLVLATGLAESRDVTIAVVKDGSGPRDAMVAAIEKELALHTPQNVTVRFRTDAGFDAAWNAGNASAALQRALDDPGVDLVLATGVMGTREAARTDLELPKPVVSSFVQPADIFDLDYDRTDRAAKANLAVVAVPSRFERDVRRFRDLVEFRKLTVAVSTDELAAIPEMRERKHMLENRVGVGIELVGVGTDPRQAATALSNAEAVYVTRLERFDRTARKQLLSALSSRGIPTFSSAGHGDVELGALVSQTPDFDDQVIRRVALNLGRLIRGESTEDLPALMTVDTRLLINAATAKEIGWSPDREIRIFARFLHPEALELAAETLELAEAFRLAEQQNRSLRVEDTAVEGAFQDQLRAKSRLLPQISSSVSWVQAETDFADAENATTGSLSLRQQIWDDAARKNYRGSQQVFESAEEDREALRLDVLADSGAAFYSLGLAQALYRIETDNLQLTEEFLELAQLRRDVGYSGREEILRWQSAAANSRSRLFRSAQDVETTRIALNRILGTDQARRWYPAESRIDPEVFPWMDGELDGLFDDTSNGERLLDEAIELALEQAPELRALDRLTDAQQIEVDRLRRRYTVPNVVAEGSYSNQLSDPDIVFFPDEWSYSVGVTAIYPLFEGNRRKHDLARARSDLDGVMRQREVVVELVEQRTRSAAQRVRNSFPRIKFSRQAADAAAESLDLVRDQYTEGTVNVTDLLDAQNQKFTADQAVTIAIFEFLADLNELERAIGWFEADNDDAERQALVGRFRAAATAP